MQRVNYGCTFRKKLEVNKTLIQTSDFCPKISKRVRNPDRPKSPQTIESNLGILSVFALL